MKHQIGFIGGGRITRVMLQALRNKETALSNVVVYETNPEVAALLKSEFPAISIATELQAAAGRPLVVLALHPPVIKSLLPTLKECLSADATILSLAPKVTIGGMANALGTSRIIRMIPNATSFINEGYNPVYFSDAFADDEKKELMSFFGLLGNTFETEEPNLEAYALISAMLPTYFWFQWKTLEQTGIEMGLSADEARSALSTTLPSAVRLFFEAGLPADEVINLIPVKPIADSEPAIASILHDTLLDFFQKIKP